MPTQNISLAAAQQQVIRAMLDRWQKDGRIKSDTEYNVLLKQYTDKVTTGTPIMDITPASDVVDANLITNTFEGFTVDIMSAYAAINKIGDTVSKHKMLNQSVLNSVELDIKKMDDKLDEYNTRLGINGAQGLYIQRFRDNNSFADWDASSFTDRNGVILAPAYQCSLDVEMEAMQLPLVSWSNQLIGKSGVHLANINIGRQLGSGFIKLKNPEHLVDKSIDESMETFWSESILSDAPIKVETGYAFQSKAGPVQYIIKNGAVCSLQINFDYMTQMSQITLTPFTEYPMKLEAILYMDEASKAWNSIVSPYDILQGQYFTSTISYEFPEITTKHLIILLNQIHYTKQDIIVSSKEERNKALWWQSTAKMALPVAYANKAIYNNQAEELPQWTSFMNNMKKQNMDLEAFMKEFNTDNNYTISKYQYDYGLYNVSVYRNEYQDHGIYVSKPLSAAGVTRAVRLATDEYHPSLDSVGVITDIEYSVTDGRNWYPIMPNNKSAILAELLIPGTVAGGQTICTPRFSFARGSSVYVYRNGLRITEVTDYTIDWARSTVAINGYDKSAVYTIGYTPDEASQTVDFLAKIPRLTSGLLDLTQMQRSVETYGGTDASGYVTLQYAPFVDKERLAALASDNTWNPTYAQSSYFPINVHIIDSGGQHIDQLLSSSDSRPVYLTNMTNYFDPSGKSNLQTLDPVKLNYQYQMIGNRIQFNTPLPANVKIAVEYPYLISNLRLKAIMRRNSHLFQGITPILNDYIMSFQTLS